MHRFFLPALKKEAETPFCMIEKIKAACKVLEYR